MAVYTDVTAEELERLLADYDLGRLIGCTGIREGVENSNFRLETTGGRFILTIYEKRVAAADLPFFLGLMAHLAERGVPCPLPVADRGGSALKQLKGKPAAIVTFLEGSWPRRLTVEHCGDLGEALAALHLGGAGFEAHRANDLSLAGWSRLMKLCRGKADGYQAGLESELARELDDLARHWPQGLPAGLVHGDLFPDNVFFAGGRLSGIIDFYFACDDLFAYDLAICLNAWCFEADMSFNLTKAKALLEGYRRRRPMAEEEVAALPVLARGSALRFLLTRLYDWLHRVDGALVRPKNPREYLARLRFHRQVRGPEVYGLV